MTVYDTLYFMHSIENSGRRQTIPSSFIFTLWKPRNERNGAFVKRSGLRGKGSAGPQKRPTVMKELTLNGFRECKKKPKVEHTTVCSETGVDAVWHVLSPYGAWC